VGVVAELVATAITLTSLVTLGPGALAPADPGCLEAVEIRRIQNGWGLSRLGGAGVVRIAVESCDLLGYEGVAVVEGVGDVPVFVVDCQQKKHEPLSDRGLVADVSWGELGHKKAIILLWQDQNQD